MVTVQNGGTKCVSKVFIEIGNPSLSVSNYNESMFQYIE